MKIFIGGAWPYANGSLHEGRRLNEPEILFLRLEKKVADEELRRLGQAFT